MITFNRKHAYVRFTRKFWTAAWDNVRSTIMYWYNVILKSINLYSGYPPIWSPTNMIGIWSRGPKFHDLLTMQYDREYDHPTIWSRLALEGWKPIWSQYDRKTRFSPKHVYDVETFTLVAQGWFRFSLHQFHRKKANRTVIFQYFGDQLTGVASQ